MSVTTYDVDEQGVALLRLDRPEARNAIDTAMLEEMLGPPGCRARATSGVRVLVLSSTDHMGLSAGADVREELDEDGRVRRMELFAAPLRRADRLSRSPTVAACHGSCVGGGAEIAVACDLRVGGSNLRLRFPGAALGVPVGPGPAGHAVRALGGQVPAPDRQGGRRRAGAPLGPRAQGRARGRNRGARRLTLAAAVAEHPPEAVARLKRMLHEWDGVEDRSRAEGEGQVEWQRSGPGLPYRS